MTKVWLIAVREFVAVVFTKAFIIGLLIMPAMIAVMAVLAPRLFGDQDFSVAGQIAVVDPTGSVMPELRAALARSGSEVALAEVIERARTGRAGEAALEAVGALTQLTLVERPADADLEQEKAWLRVADKTLPHVALVVLHRNAVAPAAGETALGSYDLYVPPKQDDRIDTAVQSALREAIINARVQARGLDRETLTGLMTVARARSVAVSDEGERGTVGALNFLLPLAFMLLLFMGVMGAGQGMLTTTIEEKSSRVIEVLLSAVSPLELMAGKLLGHMGVSLLAMSIYLGLGLIALASFSLFGMLDLKLIAYLLVFFLIAFFTIGSLMMAAGAAVNDLREAQSLMTPLMLVFIGPWMLWMPISRNPDSTLSLVVSFLPPFNSFGMLLRLASTSPPPMWQVWLSIGAGLAGVYAAVWFAAKVFRIGLLMFGKPPNLRTLIRWVRAA